MLGEQQLEIRDASIQTFQVGLISLRFVFSKKCHTYDSCAKFMIKTGKFRREVPGLFKVFIWMSISITFDFLCGSKKPRIFPKMKMTST